MSWLSENYEKAALGGAVVIALGLSFVGWSKFSSVEENFSNDPKGRGNDDPAIPAAVTVSRGKSSFSLNREWTKASDGDRPVDLFTGVPLFVNKNDLNNPVDLPKSKMVHPPIPNEWWIENRIDPGFGDSPLRDADDDGFSNLAEFEAKSDPRDPEDYPALILKLAFTGDEAVQWFVRPGYPTPDGFTFEYGDSLKRKAKVSPANPVAKGGLFFDEGPIKNRFKFIDSEVVKKRNEKMGIDVDVTMVTIEDQKPNKLSRKYTIPSNFRKANVNQFVQYDRTAILTLEALGQDGNEFKVEENVPFSLPPGKEEKRYRLVEISPEKITVEVSGGGQEKKQYEILKGAVGPKSP